MTYSIAQTGIPADNEQLPSSLQVDDAAFGRVGAMQGSMSDGLPALCKGPDGGQALYVMDAERSDPSRGIRIMRKVYPG